MKYLHQINESNSDRIVKRFSSSEYPEFDKSPQDVENMTKEELTNEIVKTSKIISAMSSPLNYIDSRLKGDHGGIDSLNLLKDENPEIDIVPGSSGYDRHVANMELFKTYLANLRQQKLALEKQEYVSTPELSPEEMKAKQNAAILKWYDKLPDGTYHGD